MVCTRLYGIDLAHVKLSATLAQHYLVAWYGLLHLNGCWGFVDFLWPPPMLGIDSDCSLRSSRPSLLAMVKLPMVFRGFSGVTKTTGRQRKETSTWLRGLPLL
jgi:hypothetical protein